MSSRGRCAGRLGRSVCDLALAVPEAKFGYPEVRRGLVAAIVMAKPSMPWLAPLVLALMKLPA